MEGYEVVTSDDSKVGHVAAVEGEHLIVEHGVLKKTKHAVPLAFAQTEESEQVVRLTVSKAIIESSPKLENGSVDTHAVAEHYGLAEGYDAPSTEGFGDVLPDDPARSADEDAIRAGRETADQQRAQIRDSGLEPDRSHETTPTGYLSDRVGSRERRD